MRIDHARGDVLDVAPNIAEALVLWLRSGFNHRFGTWWFGLKNRPLRALTPEACLDRPWLSPMDSVWELEPPMSQLRYVYVLANPTNGKGYGDLESVNGAITRSLDVLSSHGVRTIAMIHIPFAAGPEPTDEEQTAAAEAMNLPRLDGHPRRRDNAPGVIHAEAEEAVVHGGIQAGGGTAL